MTEELSILLNKYLEDEICLEELVLLAHGQGRIYQLTKQVGALKEDDYLQKAQALVATTKKLF